MKNILITTDFSENSKEAARVGIAFAQKFNADVVLLHVYSLPMPSSQFPIMIDFSAYEGIKQEQLQAFKEEIEKPGVKIKPITSIGLTFYEEIRNYTDKHPIDLIVMGLTGASRLEQIFLGSNTMSLLAHSSIPILAIPKGFSLSQKPKFAFAYDAHVIENQHNMNLLMDIVLHFESKLSVFHISQEQEREDTENHENLQVYFPEAHFTYESVYSEATDPGILAYIDKNKIDVLALIPRKHKFFDRLFHEGHTQDLANQVHIPLLALPE